MILWWVRVLNDFEVQGKPFHPYRLVLTCTSVKQATGPYKENFLNFHNLTKNSLERIQGYVDIEQEPKPTKQGVPPAHWPSSGEIRVENLSARYTLDGPAVLHDLSFSIKSGERIGVGESSVFCVL